MTERNAKDRWPIVAFGDVAKQVKDKVSPADSGLDRYIAGKHMDADDLRIRRWGIIGNDYLGPAFHMRFKPGQVLFGSRHTYLRKIAVADFEGITANTTFVIESKDATVLLPKLLPFIMQTESFHAFSVKQLHGSVNRFVNFSDLVEYEFALPPMDEQRRIVEALRAVEFLGEYSYSFHNSIDMLAKRWRIDYIDQSSASMYCVADVCVLRGGSVFKVEYQGQNQGELPFIKVSDMDLAGNEKYIRTSQNYISNQQASEIHARVLPVGSIVFAKVGAALFKNRKRILVSDTCIDNNMMAAIPNSENMLPEYLYLIFLGVDIGALAQEGAIPSVNQATLGKFKIRAPDLAQQRKLLSLYSKFESALNSSARKISKIKEIKRTLISEALSHV